MEFILVLIVLGIIARCLDNTKPSCYKKDESKRDRFNPGCTGDVCAFKYDCKYYNNYIKDE